MANVLTLAVAGSRKTQGLVEHCSLLPRERRVLLVTYTHTNQAELLARLAKYAGDHAYIDVMGWYTFLLRHFARPFFPFVFPGMRVRGFNFDGRPHRFAKGYRRFLDSNGAAYACELGRLSWQLVAASRGALLRRLECIYDEMLIDEVQDLSAHDWGIVDVLLHSSIELRMVGDVRQAVLSTNPRSSKNKKYAYANSVRWFREREAAGLLSIVEYNTTWRCNPAIARFSDTIFDASWGFPPTESLNDRLTGHDGVFLVRPDDVDDYVARYRPRCLRHGGGSGKAFHFDFLNFGLAKGANYQRILIIPTAGIGSFIRSEKALKPKAAARFYVAVTRAEQSVGIVLDNPGKSALPLWSPSD